MCSTQDASPVQSLRNFLLGRLIRSLGSSGRSCLFLRLCHFGYDGTINASMKYNFCGRVFSGWSHKTFKPLGLNRGSVATERGSSLSLSFSLVLSPSRSLDRRRCPRAIHKIGPSGHLVAPTPTCFGSPASRPGWSTPKRLTPWVDGGQPRLVDGLSMSVDVGRRLGFEPRGLIVRPAAAGDWPPVTPVLTRGTYKNTLFFVQRGRRAPLRW